MKIMTNNLDTYDKTKAWLSKNLHRNFFPSQQPEFSILVRLLNQHPSIKEWKYQTPLSFKISRSSGTGAIVMYVRFEGLNKYRIVSWVACAKKKLASHQTTNNLDNQLNSAMRYAIRSQINKYRNQHPTRICALCNTSHRIEVDHFPKHFVEIKEAFLEMKSRKNELPPTNFNWHPKKGNFMFKNGTKANSYYDKKWKQSWQRYHNKYAEYRYLCSTCNKKTNQK